MFLRVLLISLFSLSAFGLELSLKSNQIQYELNIAQDFSITLNSPQVKLEIKANKCNLKILKGFSARVELLLKNGLLTKSEHHDIELNINGDKKFTHHKHKTGNSLLDIVNQIQRMKIEEKYLCHQS